MSSISDEQFLSLTTFTKAGDPKPTPVWIVDLGDNDRGGQDVGFTTGANSWKLKRIAHTPRVTLQACDQRGKLTDGAPIVEGIARLATDAEFTQIKAKVNTKYGFMVKVIGFIGIFRKLFKGADSANAAVVVSLEH